MIWPHIIFILMDIFLHKHTCKLNTGCPILNNELRFLENYSRYGKMFQTKVVWFGRRHKKVSLI